MTSITFCLLTLVYISNLSPPLHWRGEESLPPFRRTRHTHTLLQVVIVMGIKHSRPRLKLLVHEAFSY